MNKSKLLYPLVVTDIALFCVEKESIVNLKNSTSQEDLAMWSEEEARRLRKERPKLMVLLVKRAKAPEAEHWALPGGILRPDIDDCLESTAKRILQEKTGVEVPYLSEVRSFSGPNRDPRGWSIGILHYALLPRDQIQAIVKRDVEEVKWVPAIGHSLPMAFDHATLLEHAVAALQNKVERHTLPLHLMPSKFTLGALQATCEAILNRDLDKSVFRRRLKGSTELSEVIGEMDHANGAAQRPSQIYTATAQFKF